MNNQFKPTGYNSVSPYFVIREAQRFIDFIKDLFEAEELRRYDNPDGSIMHAELRIDDSVIMLGQSNDEHPPQLHLMHVYVPDVDAVIERAVKLGCEVVEAPQQKSGDPDRRGMFRDFAGNMWAVGTQIDD